MDIDFKLLQVFTVLYDTGSVSQTANVLGLSQPTISFNLAKLRDHFQDPLFVRTPRRMEPTPCAQALVARIRPLLAAAEEVSRYRAVFEPASAARSFTLAMTDISQIVLLPTLLDRLRQVAPQVRIRVRHIGADTARQLEEGQVDLAVGFMPQLDAGFYQQKLFAQVYVALVSYRHPRIGETLTLQHLAEEGHVVVDPAGTGHHWIERLLQEQKLQRTVVLEVPSFLGLAAIVAHTDLIALVPERLATMLASPEPVRLLQLPMAMPSYLVKQHWHERNHADPGHRWLRGLMAELFLTD